MNRDTLVMVRATIIQDWKPTSQKAGAAKHKLIQLIDAELSAGAREDREALPYWEPCNPGCDPEFNGERSKGCALICQGARAALAQPSPAPELPERGTQHRFSTTEQTCRHDFAGVWWNDNGETKTGRECRHCGFFVADIAEAAEPEKQKEFGRVIVSMKGGYKCFDFDEYSHAHSYPEGEHQLYAAPVAQAGQVPDGVRILLSRAKCEIEHLAECLENVCEDDEDVDVREDVADGRVVAADIAHLLAAAPAQGGE